MFQIHEDHYGASKASSLSAPQATDLSRRRKNLYFSWLLTRMLSFPPPPPSKSVIYVYVRSVKVRKEQVQITMASNVSVELARIDEDDDDWRACMA